MAERKEKSFSNKDQSKDRIIEITKTLEWLITAFVLAFVFRAFVMEAYRIPTGSMASTLKGDHYQIRCIQCGYKYEQGYDSRSTRRRNPSGITCRCPSCGFYFESERPLPVAKGDRILVLKCIYQFFNPARWDVVVFKNPLDPTINYIKRLIGLPGETVEIIDGDIYIDGQIARKPTKLQEELLKPVYDNNYQPARPLQGSFNNHIWQQPFNAGESVWKIDENNPTMFLLESPIDKINTMFYDTSRGNGFEATYAYNDVMAYGLRPYCSDLLVRLYARSFNKESIIGVELSKYRIHYRASIQPDGNVVIEKLIDGEPIEELARKQINISFQEKPIPLIFSNLDHLLTFQVGEEKLTYDLGPSADDAGLRETRIEPRVKIFGAGKLALSHMAVFRDIHYTSSKYGNGPPEGRAVEGNPFELKESQFFVLGDNSPSSEDGRWWGKRGISNKGVESYDEGIVPGEYMVGKALFVYWPSGYEFPWPNGLRAYFNKKSRNNNFFRIINEIMFLNWIPNMGQMRFVHGGSGKKD
ncbi:MAG: signal peptidase I [Planctomycetota bacterium]|jgi:signal peptidase I